MPEGGIHPPSYPDPVLSNVNMLPDAMVGTLKPDNSGQLQPAPYTTSDPADTASVEATANPEPGPNPEPTVELPDGTVQEVTEEEKEKADAEVPHVAESKNEPSRELPSGPEDQTDADKVESTEQQAYDASDANPASDTSTEETEKEEDVTPTAQWEKVDESLTVNELKSIAKDLGIKGYSNMKEAQLIEAINTKREADASS